MFVYWLITKGAPLPTSVSFISKVLKNTGPAINVTTFRNLRSYHLAQVLKTYWTLDITCIYHIENHSYYVLPLNILIRVVEVEHVILISFNYEFESRLNTILLRRSEASVTLSLSSLIAITSSSFVIIRVRLTPLWVFVLCICESKKRVC